MITMMMMLKMAMRMMTKMTIETNLKEVGETVTQRCRLDSQAVNDDTVTAFIIIVIIVIVVIVVIDIISSS